MGDRYNVAFKATEEDTPIWLYSHWGGTSRYTAIAEALEDARSRWHDPSYATRVAISSIIGNDWSSKTGFGLNAGERPSTMGDSPECAVVIWDKRIVDIVHESDPSLSRGSLTFDEFIGMAQPVVLREV